MDIPFTQVFWRERIDLLKISCKITLKSSNKEPVLYPMAQHAMKYPHQLWTGFFAAAVTSNNVLGRLVSTPSSVFKLKRCLEGLVTRSWFWQMTCRSFISCSDGNHYAQPTYFRLWLLWSKVGWYFSNIVFVGTRYLYRIHTYITLVQSLLHLTGQFWCI